MIDPALNDDALAALLARTQQALQNAMFALALRGDEQAVLQCLDSGVPLNATNAEGHNVLVIALKHWKYSVATAVLQRGIDIHPSHPGDAQFIDHMILGNRRHVEERAPELLQAYERALLAQPASAPSAPALQRLADLPARHHMVHAHA